MHKYFLRHQCLSCTVFPNTLPTATVILYFWFFFFSYVFLFFIFYLCATFYIFRNTLCVARHFVHCSHFIFLWLIFQPRMIFVLLDFLYISFSLCFPILCPLQSFGPRGIFFFSQKILSSKFSQRIILHYFFPKLLLNKFYLKILNIHTIKKLCKYNSKLSS